MSRVKCVAQRAVMRAREEHAFRQYHRCLKRGRTLKHGSPEWRANHAHRLAWQKLYLERRAKRRALDARIARLPIAQTSQRGIEFITRREGCVLHPYNDSRGFATIGVGHLIAQRRVNAADKAKYAHFDQHDADALLARDLDRFEKAVAEAFNGSPLARGDYQAEFDGAVSLAFNIGDAGFASSTVAHEIHAGRKQQAADAFLMWDKPPELLPRRRLERDLFLRGRYS